MANVYSVVVQAGEGTQPIIAGTHRTTLRNLINVFQRLAGGSQTASYTLQLRSAEAFASGTVTVASAALNDTITINNHAFTAKTSNPTGDQFLVGVTDTDDAAAAAVAINASTTAGVKGIVTASAAAGVLTISAAQPGLLGNAVTLASSNNTRLAVSAARLAGGAETLSSVAL